ncbi:hypothetical protein EP504_05045 [Salmonella enterica]|nr:hypothetical protein [Salmonella enterica]EAT1843321.1 hypothetical protein [Salmonella enterica]
MTKQAAPALRKFSGSIARFLRDVYTCHPPGCRHVDTARDFQTIHLPADLRAICDRDTLQLAPARPDAVAGQVGNALTRGVHYRKSGDYVANLYVA